MAGAVKYKVAEAARLTGVSASTLRLWELQGLIEPERTPGGQRCYSEQHLDQLKRIQWQRAEQGFGLAHQVPPMAVRHVQRLAGRLQAAGALHADQQLDQPR